MRFRIQHQTVYTYEAPVFLAPQVVRLKPRSDAAQQLLSFEIRVDPQPAGLSESLDLDGHAAHQMWFEGLTDHLKIETVSDVETIRANPFDFLWQGPERLPLAYDRTHQRALFPYLQNEAGPDVEALASRVASQAGGEPLAFLPTLNLAIHKACRQVFRLEGDPMPADETLRRGEGSCRDLTMVFLEAARTQGFAGRFVSGYYAEPNVDSHELHAWAEVYLPGGGWRGYDPSNGLAAAERHIAGAAAADPKLAAPLSGSLLGHGKAHLETSVRVEEL